MPRRANTPKSAKPRNTAAATAPAQAAPPRAPVHDVEVLRRELARKLEMFVSDWRRCPRRLCRRLRSCHPGDDFCPSPRPNPRPMTPEQQDRAKAALGRELKRRLAAMRAL